MSQQKTKKTLINWDLVTVNPNNKTWDWSDFKNIKKLPYILSGGLNVTNIKKAINLTGADFVDINSGVEEQPGEKSLSLIDGIKISNDESWGLIRASNTSPKITLRFESVTEDGLKSIKNDIKNAILKIDNKLDLPF